jgi:hypothetical protein
MSELLGEGKRVTVITPPNVASTYASPNPRRVVALASISGLLIALLYALAAAFPHYLTRDEKIKWKALFLDFLADFPFVNRLKQLSYRLKKAPNVS